MAKKKVTRKKKTTKRKIVRVQVPSHDQVDMLRGLLAARIQQLSEDSRQDLPGIKTMPGDAWTYRENPELHLQRKKEKDPLAAYTFAFWLMTTCYFIQLAVWLHGRL